MRPLHSFIETSVSALHKVSVTHCWAIKLGTILDTYTTNKIIGGYTKCREVRTAHYLFDEMLERDTASWNTMIAGYVNFGDLETAWKLLLTMKRCGFGVDEYTFGSILKGIACDCKIDVGKQVHSVIVKIGYEQNVYAGSALLDMYAKCQRVEDAYVVFQGMPERNSVSWNALIAGYAQVDDRWMAFWLLDCMEREAMEINDGTFAPILTLLDDPKFYKLTMQVHAKIVKHGVEFYTIICNASITSYSECGSIDDAERVFDGAVEFRDLVMWNSMLAAYLVHNQVLLALEIFLEMQVLGFEPDIYTYTSVISGCFEEAHQSQGKSLHALIIKRGLEKSVPITNSLIAIYLKSNSKSMEDSVAIFESMESRDQVSWNAILTGFSQMGLGENALRFFRSMRTEHVAIDHYALSAVLRSCSDLATLQLGQQIHVLALKSGFESNDYVASSLIFMYSKCGTIEDAQKSFEETSQDSSITWNSIMFGYAQHGQGNIALGLFYLMTERKVKPDHITFVSVLTACSHIGLIEQGCNFLNSMQSDYGIPPRMEHYACTIDLCGRAGRLDVAKALIDAMPFEPDSMVWKTLLGACRMCGNIEMASEVASHLLELEPQEHCTYILLSNMYGHLGRWDEIARIKRLMRDRGVKKVPGWSWIEVKNEVHAFNAEDHSHSHCEEIYQILEKLMEEMRIKDHIGDLEFLVLG